MTTLTETEHKPKQFLIMQKVQDNPSLGTLIKQFKSTLTPDQTDTFLQIERLLVERVHREMSELGVN